MDVQPFEISGIPRRYREAARHGRPRNERIAQMQGPAGAMRLRPQRGRPLGFRTAHRQNSLLIRRNKRGQGGSYAAAAASARKAAQAENSSS